MLPSCFFLTSYSLPPTLGCLGWGIIPDDLLAHRTFILNSQSRPISNFFFLASHAMICQSYSLLTSFPVWLKLYPLGVSMYITCSTCVFSLPSSSQVVCVDIARLTIFGYNHYIVSWGGSRQKRNYFKGIFPLPVEALEYEIDLLIRRKWGHV